MFNSPEIKSSDMYRLVYDYFCLKITASAKIFGSGLKSQRLGLGLGITEPGHCPTSSGLVNSTVGQ